MRSPLEALDRVAHAAALLGALAARDVPLGARTTYRAGGRAALLAEVAQVEDVAVVAGAVEASGIEVLVVGNGSNLLVPDRGFAGLAVVLGEGLAGVEPDGPAATVVAGGAVPYPVLARACVAAGLRGMEWAVGIPGSVGGAVAMNAGGHGSETSDRLVRALLVDLRTGASRSVGPRDLDLAYRRSNVRADEIVVEAEFACERGDAAAGAEEIASIVRWRREHQPGGRNAGSVFRNPPGGSAGQLVEAAGMKGARVRSAQVSEKHANFIQLETGGRADDVLELVEVVREAVAERTGVELAVELRVAGAAR
ncbi:MAG: UDP-N-acetylmuramate dehydrogenase [Actinomycetota bacterium]|nr:UDP-N-acetylmuramate dehydrogenase [Actinomycetota bacterium]